MPDNFIDVISTTGQTILKTSEIKAHVLHGDGAFRRVMIEEVVDLQDFVDDVIDKLYGKPKRKRIG